MNIRFLAALLTCGALWAGDLGQRRLDGKAHVYVSYSINCHDWLDPDLSSKAVLRTARLFAKHGLRADFYVTGSLANAWAEKAPGTIEELKRLGMGFGYHQRPPHPIWFDAAQRRALMAMPPEAAYKEFERYESERLDVTTGTTIAGKPGGYRGAATLFGAPVPALGAGSAPPNLVALDREVLRRMGARMVVAFHSQGNKDYPLLWWQGLLARPSDFSVVRVPPNSRQLAAKTQVLPRGTLAGEESGNFWWNVTDDPEAQEHSPVKYLSRKMADAPSDKITYVTCLIHEDNWYKAGNSWDATYYEGRGRTQPKTPPFTPEPRKNIRMRDSEEQERIWKWWDELVQYTASDKRIRVMTAGELAAMVRSDDLERSFDRATVMAAAKVVAASSGKLPEFVALDNDALSLSDCVQVFSRALAGSKQLRVRTVLGPIRPPSRAPTQPETVSAKDATAAAREIVTMLDRKQVPEILPATVKTGGKEIAMESYLYAAARALMGDKESITVPSLASVGPDPAQWTIKPARVR